MLECNSSVTEDVAESNNLQIKALVLDIMGMTIHNGSGIRSLVRLKGCPLHCAWCSAPESQSGAPEIGIDSSKCTHCGRCLAVCSPGAISLIDETIRIDREKCNNCGECTKVCYAGAVKVYGKYMTVEAVLKRVKKDELFYKHSGGGVVISGGECLSQFEFTKTLAQACKAEGISVGIDTCGYVLWNNIEQILGFTDYFLYDIKHMDSIRHKEITGAPNELVISNALRISERGVPIYIRIPLIPGYTDSEENLRAISSFAAGLSGLVEVDLMPFHHLGEKTYEALNRSYSMADVLMIPKEKIQGMQQLVESFGVSCKIIG